MNENSPQEMEDVRNPEACDQAPAQNETQEKADGKEEAMQEGGERLENDASGNLEDLPLFEDPGQAVDPDPSEAQGADDGIALADLQNELKQLRAQLKERQETLLRLGREYEEFAELYPEIPLTSLSSGVWEDVQKGVPLAAAYALAERKKHRLNELARQANTENASRSSGSLSVPPSDYLSPAEVRAMSQSEVRANYQKIMRSIQKWH